MAMTKKQTMLVGMMQKEIFKKYMELFGDVEFITTVLDRAAVLTTIMSLDLIKDGDVSSKEELIEALDNAFEDMNQEAILDYLDAMASFMGLNEKQMKLYEKLK